MTRLLSTMTLAALFATTAMAEPAPDIPDQAPAVCDSADFENQGQWVKCLVQSGVRGKELARTIHAEHQARKGGETTEKSKRKAKKRAKNAMHKEKRNRGR